MLTMSQALGPAQFSGLTSIAAGDTLTTAYPRPSASSMKEPPAAARFALAIHLLRRPARVVHGVVPEGEREQKGGHEHQQRDHLEQQREHHHEAAARLPPREQLAGRAGNVEREHEEGDDANEKDRRLARLAGVGPCPPR